MTIPDPHGTGPSSIDFASQHDSTIPMSSTNPPPSSSKDVVQDEWTLPDLMPFAIMDESLRCPICKEFFRACVQLPCQHRFCSLCVRSYSTSKMECPSCRSSIHGMHVLKPDKLMNVLVEQFQTIRRSFLGPLNALVSNKVAKSANDRQSEVSRCTTKRKHRLNTPSEDVPGSPSPPHVQETQSSVAKRSKSTNDALDTVVSLSNSSFENKIAHSSLLSLAQKVESRSSPLKQASPPRPQSNNAQQPKRTTSVTALFRQQEQQQNTSSGGLQPGVEEKVQCPICNKMVLMKFLNPHLDSGCTSHILLAPPSDPTISTVQSHNSDPRVNMMDPDIEILGESSSRSRTKTRTNQSGSMDGNFHDDDNFVVFENPPTKSSGGTDSTGRITRSSSRRKENIEPSKPEIPPVASLEKEMERISSYLQQGSDTQRRPKPSVAYSMLKDAKIRSMLAEEGLNSRGDRSTLIKRHTQWILRYNANLDSMQPASLDSLRKDMQEWESSLKKHSSGAFSSGSGTTEVFRSTHHRYSSSETSASSEVDPKLIAERMKLAQHAEKYKEEFDELIEQVRARMKQLKEKKNQSSHAEAEEKDKIEQPPIV